MNLPFTLSAAIVHRVRNSMQDSAHNQADMVQGMIEDAIKRSRVLTGPPSIVDLKREYARLDALHENWKLLPSSTYRDEKLSAICASKAEIAEKIFRDGSITFFAKKGTP